MDDDARAAAGPTRAARIGAALGGALILAAILLPWREGRSGFASVERLLALSEIEGIREAVPPRWTLVCWYLLPLAACALLLAAPFGSRWLLLALAVAASVIAVVVAVAVLRSSDADTLGPAVSIAGGAIALASTLIPVRTFRTTAT